jgi:heat shock protein HspQ
MKHEITITATITIDVNPKNYPDSETPEEMLAVDMEQVDDDPFAYLEGDNVEWSFTGRILP